MPINNPQDIQPLGGAPLGAPDYPAYPLACSAAGTASPSGSATATVTVVAAGGAADKKRKKRHAIVAGKIVAYESKSELRSLKRKAREQIEEERRVIAKTPLAPSLPIDRHPLEAAVAKGEIWGRVERHAADAQKELVAAQEVHVQALAEAAEKAAREEALWHEMEEEALLLLVTA